MTGSPPLPSVFPVREDRPSSRMGSPRRPGASTAELVRLRLPDRPGALAAVTAQLASYEVDVLRVEVVDRELGSAVDDLLVSGERLEAALDGLGSRALVLGRRRGVDLGDPALAMAEACETVSSARDERDWQRRLVRSALTLVVADAGVLCARRDGGLVAVLAASVSELPLAVEAPTRSLIDSALESGECLTADGRIPWAPSALRAGLPAGAVAVVPLPAASLVLAVLRHDHSPFVAAELERLAALLRFAGRRLGPPEVVTIASRVRVELGRSTP